MSITSLRLEKPKSVWARFLQFSLWKRIVIVIIVIGLLGFVGLKVFGQKSNKQNYQTATAQRGSIISSVSESGNISASSQVSITSPSTGIIQEVYVKNGDQVTAGENLFKVKATATPEEKASAYASYLNAQNTLNSAQAKLNSLQSALFKANQTFINDKGVSNPTDLEKTDPKYVEENADWLQAEADYKNQTGVINQAQAALQSSSLAYQATQDSIVTAPTDGTVANLSVSSGNSVTASASNNNNSSSNSNSSDASSSSSNSSDSSSSSSNSTGSSTSSGSTVMVIGNFSQLSVVAQVSEVDIPKIKVGQNATITLDAFPDKTYVGKVTSVNTIGAESSGVVTYDVYIDLISPPSDIRSGMTASVIIQTASKDNVITVPSAAIQTSDSSSYVRVLKNGKVTQVPVTTGITSDTDTEITSGLNEGDVVVTSMNTTATGTSSTASPFGGGFGGKGGGGAVIRSGGGKGFGG